MSQKFYTQIEMTVEPSSSNHVVTKTYLESVLPAPSQQKVSVLCATTSVLDATYSGVGKTLTANGNGAISMDDQSPTATKRVLVKNQSGANRTENGIYTVTTVGDGSNPYVLTRATDFDEDSDILAGNFVLVEQGTANADTMWVLTTNNPIVLDTSLLEFSKLAPTTYTAGDGIDITGFSVAVDVTDIAGTGLESDGGSPANLRIASEAAGDGLTGGSGSALAVGAGTGIDVTADAVSVDVTDIIDTASGLKEGTGGTANMIQVNLDTDKGLAFYTNKVGVNVESDGGIQFDGTNKGLELKLNGTSLTVGASGASITTYSTTFNNTSDWSGAGPYTITKAAATHGLGTGKNRDVKVFESDNLVVVDVAVADNGDVTISSSAKFAGTIAIS